MSDPLSIATALLAAHIPGGEEYAAALAETPVVVKIEKVLASSSAPRKGKASAVAMVRPVPTKESAAVFRRAILQAGLMVQATNKDGTPSFNDHGHPVMIKDEARKSRLIKEAVSAFVGWDNQQAPGNQISMAMNRARMLEKPELGQDKPVRTAPSVAGFVAGTFDGAERVKQDVRGKVRALVDAACKAEHGGDKALCERLRVAAQNLAATIGE